MQSCIVCKVRQKEIVLDCSRLQKNIFRVLKLLHEIGLLSLQPPILPEPTKYDKNKHKYKHKLPSDTQPHHHCLITHEALQLIWRSALLTSNIGLATMVVKEISKNRLVGRSNELSHILATLTRKVQTMTDHLGKDDISVKSASEKLQTLRQLQQKINQKWASIQQIQTSKTENNLQNDLLSLFSTNIPAKQAEQLIHEARRQLFTLDMKILRKSIMFIQEVETGHCIVSLQQCYPSFMVYKELFKSIIGHQHYYQALKQLLLAKERSYSEHKQFKPNDYLMCHFCGKIQTKVDHQSKKDSNENSTAINKGQICSNVPEPATVYSLSYAFQQIFLKSNYACLPLEPLAQREKRQCYQLCRNYQRYLHPYAETFIEQCNRYYCQECKVKTILNQPKDQASQNKPCAYCQRRCTCERCLNLERFNKLLALYHSLGGNFEDVSSQLMFLNFCSNRVHMQLVTFEQPNGNSVTLLHEEQQIQLERQQYQNSVKIIESKEISYIQKVTQLESLFYNASKSGSNDPQPQVEKVYPQVQNLFNKLLQEQKSDSGSSSSKGSQMDLSDKESNE